MQKPDELDPDGPDATVSTAKKGEAAPDNTIQIYNTDDKQLTEEPEIEQIQEASITSREIVTDNSQSPQVINERNVNDQPSLKADNAHNLSAIMQRFKTWFRSLHVTVDVYRTVCLYVSFIAMGFGMSMIGATLLHMEILFHVGPQTIAWTLTCHAFGQLAGITIGGLIYKYLNLDLQFTICNLVESVATIVTPFTGNIYVYFVFVVIQGMSRGFLSTQAQCCIVLMWSWHKYGACLVHALSVAISIGFCVGPLITGSFLVDIPHTNSTDCQSSESNNCDGRLPQVDVSLSRYAYVVIGLISFVPAGMFAVAYGRHRFRRKTVVSNSNVAHDTAAKSAESEDDAGRTNSSQLVPEVPTAKSIELKRRRRLLTIGFVGVLFLSFHANAYIEATTWAQLVPFTSRYLGWSTERCTHLLSVYGAAVFVGCTLAVIASAFIKPLTILGIDAFFVVIGCLLMLAVRVFPDIMWLSVALAGAFISPNFATAVLYADDMITMSAHLSAILMFGFFSGCMAAPLVAAHLVASSCGPMCAVYVMVSASIMFAMVFFALAAFGSAIVRLKRDETEK